MRVLALLSIVGSVSCGDDGTSVTVPAPTQGTNVTVNFSGTLTLNGAAAFPFVSITSGSIFVTLLCVQNQANPNPCGLNPLPAADANLKVGLLIGTWDGSRCASGGSGTFNDAATQGASVAAFAIVSGTYCARVYDSTGNLAQPASYQIAVSHPGT